ncbi:MAG TPA: LacI family DNA-binding transcriptional regulator, partial [Polyangiaceae bacterium]|nr:LacI family DNA-binding transcriptional regulator [Polyangiaceae bacterium]
MISSLELARLCGVSQGTVDRALHDRPGIKQKTRELVLKAAAEHGYRPNPAVRTLLGGESEVVGAVIPRSRSVFFVDLLDAVRVALEERGLWLYSTSASNDAAFIAALEDMAARRMRAIVVVPPREGLPLPKHLSLPIASLLSAVKAPHTLLIAPDEIETGRRATEYLIEKGHRVIWHLTYARSARGIDDRLKGYELAMGKHGLAPALVRELAPNSL